MLTLKLWGLHRWVRTGLGEISGVDFVARSQSLPTVLQARYLINSWAAVFSWARPKFPKPCAGQTPG